MTTGKETDVTTTWPKVSVCVLSYNRREKLKLTLSKLFSELLYPLECLQVIVVENGSNDHSAEMVAEKFPAVTLIARKTNIGVTGWNEAFRIADGKYCLVLDDDAFLEGATLQKAVERMEFDSQLGILGFRILAPHDGLDFTQSYPTGKLSFWGCGALLRKQMIDEIGGYDPHFFFQAFELDYSIRARTKGWNVDFAHDLPVYHMTSTGGPQTARKFYFSRRNLVIVTLKLFDWNQLPKILRGQIKTTWQFGADQSLMTRARAVIDGIVIGLWAKLSARRASPVLQDEYANNFAEFAPAKLQGIIWTDHSRRYWRDRPEHYPPIFDQKVAGELAKRATLLRSDGFKDGDAHRGDGWFSLKIGKEPTDSFVIPYNSADGEHLLMRLSAPNDDKGDALAIMQAVVDGQVAATWKVANASSHPAIRLVLPPAPSGGHLQFHAVSRSGTTDLGSMYWSFLKLANGRESEADRKVLNCQAEQELMKPIDLIEGGPRPFVIHASVAEGYLPTIKLPDLIWHHEPSRRNECQELFFNRARISTLYYANEKYRCAIIRKRWMLLHPPAPGEEPATVTFVRQSQDHNVFALDVAYPNSKAERAELVIELLDEGRTVFSGCTALTSDQQYSIHCKLPSDAEWNELRVSARMAPAALNNYDSSIYLLSPRLLMTPPRDEHRHRGNRLVIFTHSLNVDGANAEVMHAVGKPEFRNHFSDILVVSPVFGQLRQELEEIGISVMCGYERFPPEEREAILMNYLKQSSTVWINTIDHPLELWKALARIRRPSLLFGHEAMGPDSLVRQTIRWQPHFGEIMSELVATGDLKIGFPSSSTVTQAQVALDQRDILRLSYGVEVNALTTRTWPDEIDVLEFVVPGWFCRRKNQANLVGVFEEIERTLKATSQPLRDWRLTFAGTSFSNYQYLDFANEVTTRLPASKLRFLPLLSHDAMTELLQRSHVLLVNSLSEALPVTIIEMMITGGLVITSDVEGSEDLISPDNGFIYPRMDFSAAYQTIIEILDPKKTKVSRIRGISEAAVQSTKKYSIGAYLTQMLQILRRKNSGVYAHLGHLGSTNEKLHVFSTREFHALPRTRLVWFPGTTLSGDYLLSIDIKGSDEKDWTSLVSHDGIFRLLNGVEVPSKYWSSPVSIRLRSEESVDLQRVAERLTLSTDSLIC